MLDWPKWKLPITDELRAIKENKVYKIINKPDNVKTISSRWVFRIKDNIDGSSLYKAQLAARGFEDNRLFDFGELYAPVAKLSTFRLLLTVSSYRKFFIHQLDINNAFFKWFVK